MVVNPIGDSVFASESCDCCARCRWCWCNGNKLPDTLRAHLTFTSGMRADDVCDDSTCTNPDSVSLDCSVFDLDITFDISFAEQSTNTCYYTHTEDLSSSVTSFAPCVTIFGGCTFKSLVFTRTLVLQYYPCDHYTHAGRYRDPQFPQGILLFSFGYDIDTSDPGYLALVAGGCDFFAKANCCYRSYSTAVLDEDTFSCDPDAFLAEYTLYYHEVFAGTDTVVGTLTITNIP